MELKFLDDGWPFGRLKVSVRIMRGIDVFDVKYPFFIFRTK